MNLYLGQNKVEKSVSLLLFFQTGMTPLFPMGPYLTCPSGPLPRSLPRFPSPHKSLFLFGLVPYSLVSLRSILPLRPISECGFCCPPLAPGAAPAHRHAPQGVTTRLGHAWGGPGVRGQARCLSAFTLLSSKKPREPAACPSSHRFLI